MFKFLKKLFEKKSEDVTIKITDDIKPENVHCFELVLGFDVSPGSDTIDMHVNRVALFATNETAKRYIDKLDTRMLKHTVSTLCIGASQHVTMSDKDFVKNEDLKPLTEVDILDLESLVPPTDKSKLN